MEKKVRIPVEVSTYVEKLFFEYNESLNILRYLMSQDDVKDEYIQRYSESSEEKYMELETAKREISKEYAPAEFDRYNYNFDFDNYIITYTGV